MINDDRLIRFTLNNWCFGKDNTGDIKEYENFLDISTKINNTKKVRIKIFPVTHCTRQFLEGLGDCRWKCRLYARPWKSRISCSTLTLL